MGSRAAEERRMPQADEGYVPRMDDEDEEIEDQEIDEEPEPESENDAQPARRPVTPARAAAQAAVSQAAAKEAARRRSPFERSCMNLLQVEDKDITPEDLYELVSEKVLDKAEFDEQIAELKRQHAAEMVGLKKKVVRLSKIIDRLINDED